MKTLLPIVFTLLIACLSDTAAADRDVPALFPETTAYDDIDQSIAASRQAAIEHDKLLMIVMGADWCHDSRAFVNYLQDPSFAALVEQRFIVQRVNVGYYDFVRDVITRWNVPVIYGTPTVLVVEPVTDTLLNRDSLPTWRNAASMSATDATAYFDDFQPGPPTVTPQPSPALMEALAEIDQYEQDQADRIYLAYAEIGAMMREMGDARPGPAFNEKWDQLAAMRRDITVDLERLRTEARTRAAAGETDIELAYPHYPLFID